MEHPATEFLRLVDNWFVSFLGKIRSCSQSGGSCTDDSDFLTISLFHLRDYFSLLFFFFCFLILGEGLGMVVDIIRDETSDPTNGNRLFNVFTVAFGFTGVITNATQ